MAHELFNLLEDMTTKRIYHCYQSQGLSSWFNLEVTDVNGDMQYLNGESLDELATDLKTIYPLLTTPKKKKTAMTIGDLI